MALPLVLFENIFEDATPTVTTTPASGFPITNITDWRTSTAYRWKSGSTTVDQEIIIDLGVGNTASPDTIAIAGHNLGTVSGTYRTYYSDTATTGPWTALHAAVSPTDDYPSLTKFTASAHRYYNVTIGGATWSAAPQIGVLCLGRRLDWTEPALPDLDPYGETAVVEDATNENGHYLGANVRYTRKMFRFNYDAPGFTKSDFFRPSSGLKFDDDFIPHAIRSAKPFFFAWNTDEDSDQIYLCRVADYSVQMPFVTSTNRRSLYMAFEARRETS